MWSHDSIHLLMRLGESSASTDGAAPATQPTANAHERATDRENEDVAGFSRKQIR